MYVELGFQFTYYNYRLQIAFSTEVANLNNFQINFPVQSLGSVECFIENGFVSDASLAACIILYKR